jgi:hypothetical protein
MLIFSQPTKPNGAGKTKASKPTPPTPKKVQKEEKKRQVELQASSKTSTESKNFGTSPALTTSSKSSSRTTSESISTSKSLANAQSSKSSSRTTSESINSGLKNGNSEVPTNPLLSKVTEADTNNCGKKQALCPTKLVQAGFKKGRENSPKSASVSSQKSASVSLQKSTSVSSQKSPAASPQKLTAKQVVTKVAVCVNPNEVY